jgi:uncharacterized C2H2 Zn-finger protein
MNEKKLVLVVRRKFPGLSAKDIEMMLIRVKKENNDTYTGLSMAAFIALVKKDIHDQNKRKVEECKEEKRKLSLTCSMCLHMFSDQSACSRHMKAKHGKVRIKAKETEMTGYDKKCPHCRKCFKYEFSREYHIEKFHSKDKSEKHSSSDEASSFVCEKCRKVFKHEPSLKRHMLTHDQNDSFECERCGTRFSRKDNLIKHEKRVHSLGNLNVGITRKGDIREFVCKMCGRNFGPDRIKYEAHLMLRVCQMEQEDNVEIDDRLRFPCNQCEKTYNEKDTLDRHVRWKHGEQIQPFSCLECGASFKYKSSLKRHMKTEHVESD